jgi:Xaa-Pro dipeptidase
MMMNEERLRLSLAAHQLDAVVATSPENVTYLSGFWCLPQWIRRGPQAFAVFAPATATQPVQVIAPTSTLDLVGDQMVQGEIYRYGAFHVEADPRPLANQPEVLDDANQRHSVLRNRADHVTAVTALTAALNDHRLNKARIGLDETGLSLDDVTRLKSAFPDAVFEPANDLLRQVRAVKTEAEISHLARIAATTERSISAALDAAQIGMSEQEMARIFHGQTVNEDAMPVLGCIGFGERTALMNVQPSSRRLQQRDLIRFDVGGHYGQYRADIARIASVGEPSREVRTKFDALYKGVMRGIDMVRPGIQAGDLFDAIIDTVRQEGILHYQRNHVGHGIGLDGYDFPLIAPGSATVLEAGMVLCLETPYYEIGRFGLQVEDMLVVREDGAEVLSAMGSQLRVL